MPATAIPAQLGAPLGPAVEVASVPNGDLSAGQDGWGVIGPASSLVVGEGPVLSATDNVTVLSPVIDLPPNAQVLPVAIGAPGANTVVQVRVRPLDGGAEAVVGVIDPARAVRSYDIPVGQFAGHPIRVVLDPTMAIGRRIVIGGIGPVQATLPGWSVASGTPVVQTLWGRTAIRVVGTALFATSPPVAVAPRLLLGFALRGQGTVRATAGRGAVTVTARPNQWTWAHLRVRPKRGSAAIVITATPSDEGTLAVGPVGVPARQVGLSGVSASSGEVLATVGPRAQGMRVEVRQGPRMLAAGRVSASGSVTLMVSGTGRATVQVLGDVTRAGASRPVQLG